MAACKQRRRPGGAGREHRFQGGPNGPTFVYQLQGGNYNNWTDCGTSLPALSWPQSSTCNANADPSNPNGAFSFQLTSNTVNSLSVRARDRAGNISATATVQITQDNNAPGVVRHQNSNGSYAQFGANDIVTGNGYALISWEPPAATDIAGFLLYYGYLNSAGTALSTSGNMASSNANDVSPGTFVPQGGSPIDVGYPCSTNSAGNDCSFNLTGLTNGTAFYVTLAAYDKTQVPGPNVGASTPLVTVLPSVLVPRLVGLLSPASLGLAGGSTHSVVVRDGLAYVTTSSATNTILSVVDLTLPSSPVLLGGYSPLAAGNAMYIQGNYLYIADGTSGLRVMSIATPSSPSLLSTLAPQAGQQTTGVTVSGGTVYTVARQTAFGANNSNSTLRVYSTSGGVCSMSSLCITSTFNANANNLFTNDDYYTVAAQGNLVYIGGYQYGTTFNMNNLTTPTVLNPNFSGGYGFINGCSGIAVSGPYLYCSSNSTNALYVYNISTPINPVQIYKVSTTGMPSGGLAVAGPYVYATMVGSTGSGVFGGYNIFQVAESTNGTPQLSYVYGYSDPNYSTNLNTYVAGDANRGWVPGGIQVVGNFIVVAAGTDGLQIFDTTSVHSIASATTGISPQEAGYTNAQVYGSMIMVGYNWGVQAYDASVSGVASSFLLDSSADETTSYSAIGDYSVVSGQDNAGETGGLYLARLQPSGALTGVAMFDDPNGETPVGTAVRWPYAFYYGYNSTAAQYTLRALNLATQTVAGTIAMPTPTSPLMQNIENAVGVGCTNIAIYGTDAYVTDGSSIHVVNISNPAAMSIVTTIADPAACNEVVFGRRLYLSSTDVYSLTTPAAPVQIGTGGNPNITGFGLAVSGTYVYSVGLGNNANAIAGFDGGSGRTSGMTLYDLTTPNAPTTLGAFGFADGGSTLVPFNNQVLIMNVEMDGSYILTLE